MNDIEVYKLSGVPNTEVPDVIAEVQLDPRYISHKVLPEGGGKSTLIFFIRKPSGPALDRAELITPKEYRGA